MTSRSPASALVRNARCAVLVFPLLAATLLADNAPRVRESFDLGWRFLKSDATAAEQTGFDDAAWRRLSLPHDWSIEGPFDEKAPTGGPGGYLPTGVGWYRKHFTVPGTLRGRKVTVEFDGVYMNSDVWINGRHLGRWPYGYSSFAYDLTPFLIFGDQPNVLAVRVDNSAQPNSRWYSGSGIYRHVWITITNPVHVAHWGTYATTPEVSAEAATVRIRTRVQNDRAEIQTVTLVSELLDAAGQIVATAKSDDQLPAGGEREFDQMVTMKHPRLWSPDTPDLYRVRTLVQTGGKVVDSYETPIGIRSIVDDVDRGFLLNGQPVKLQGMCLHHDGGAVGAAVPEGVWVRRLRLLKEMGCNAIRTSHNPPAPEFLNLCDQLGFLVMDEAFDEWTVQKGQIQHGYSEFFNDWYERDLVNMIRRDRNHPGVIMWSAGNEIGEQRMAGGEKVLAKLVEVLHREDPTRPVTAAMDNIYTDKGAAPEAFTDLLDIVGYNYVDRWGSRRETFYADDRRKYPQRKFVGTENVCIGGVRGSYEFSSVPAGGAPQPPRYATAMVRGEQLWKFTRLADYVIGDFLWTGIDYLGESRWPRRSSFSGVLDTGGFAKDGYYFYQSQWTARPVLHLFPHWNWRGREGQVIPVIAYSNCDTVELFLNGRSLGAKAQEFPRQGTAGGWNTYARPQILPTTADLHLSWDVPYEPGVLKAVGYREGKQVAETEIHTAGAAATIALSIDRDTLPAGSREVANVTVEVRDANGVMVPTADNLITWGVQGEGVLVGVDSGDPLSHESFQGSTGKAFNGLMLGIVQAGARPGEVRVSAAADGLKGATVVLHVVERPDAPRPMIVGLDQ
jgi:beta-galactosidase